MHVATYAQTSMHATENMWNSAYWMGLEEVRDASGNLVTGYGVESHSGIDWSQPVPEPSSLLVLAGSPVGLAGMIRRRRS